MTDNNPLMESGAGRFASRRGSVAQDAEFILRKRMAGVPVSAIARMVGRSEPDVAAICRDLAPAEPGKPEAVVIPHCIPAPRKPVKPAKRRACARGRHLSMPPLARMYAEEMCALRGVEVAALLGEGRAKGIGQLRQELYWRLSKAGYNNCEIGNFVGGRDPSTVRHGIILHQGRLDADTDLAAWRAFGRAA
jgi:hypothetical protein